MNFWFWVDSIGWIFLLWTIASNILHKEKPTCLLQRSNNRAHHQHHRDRIMERMSLVPRIGGVPTTPCPKSEKKETSCPYFFHPQFWGQKWLRQFHERLDFWFFLLENPPCQSISRFFGGMGVFFWQGARKCQSYFLLARGFFWLIPLQEHRVTNGSCIMMKSVVYILLSAKRRTCLCRSTAIEMGGVSRSFFKKLSGSEVNSSNFPEGQRHTN